MENLYGAGSKSVSGAFMVANGFCCITPPPSYSKPGSSPGAAPNLVHSNVV